MQTTLNRLLLAAVLITGATSAFAQSTAPTPATPVTPAKETKEPSELTPALKLEKIEITGSRIRRVDVEGPSPVSSYNHEYIRSTGAMNLADFLNMLPQTYGGIGAGRGSSPNDLSLEFGQRNENGFPATPFVGASPTLTPLAQTGVSGVSLRGLGSGSTLVLVDGRRPPQSAQRNLGTSTGQSFFDLNTIPLGLIDRIEVITDGTSAIYGADAVAGVINIILKKNWVGTELSSSFKFSEHGGGRERSVNLTTGFASGKLRGTLSMDYYDRAPMYASQREFSANMDHRDRIRSYNTTTNLPIYGLDNRIQFGYPATVQASGGVVAGTFDALPGIRVVLTPFGYATTPRVADFIPRTAPGDGQSGTAVNAQGQRQTNVSDQLELIPQSERYGVSGNASYTFNSGLEVYTSYRFSDSRGFATSLPAYSANVLVPAANNPFNQAVTIGMLHYEFGTISQRTKTESHALTAGVKGALGDSWHWDSGVSWSQSDLAQVNRNFNNAAFIAAVQNVDPALRFNPFIDVRAGAPSQAKLYEAMALYPTVDAISKFRTWDFTADGDLFEIWGGDIKAAIGGSYDKAESTNDSITYSAAVPSISTQTIYETSRETYAAFAEVMVPVFGKSNAVAGLRRLEFQVATRYQDEGAAGDSIVPKFGVSWVPIESLLVRASFSKGFRAPSLTETQVASQPPLNTNVNDPRRGGILTPVEVIRGPNPNLGPETSTNEFYGIVYEPKFVKGLNLSVNYYRTIQEDAIQNISQSTILNNEASFPDRVERDAPSAADIAAGQPGAIKRITIYYVNFGEVRNESIDFTAEYRLPWETFGRWRVSANASHTLDATRKLTPGALPIDDTGDTYAPPKWKGISSIFWNGGSWNASAMLSYMSGFKTNLAGISGVPQLQSAPGVSKLDLRAGYDFRNGLWRGYGKDLRISVGVSNVLDKEPPFYDVVYGYNAGLHSAYALGRAYELSFVLPF
ncbi:TonB-dependent receptor plug domain-containing protein [Oleiharenicola lentus]|uniref:TonB-dependent receptor plug domain-containing protein n=1 Tax=Oleiharenicola lentus TaxID=2508720 RepID=UPI003F67CED1